MNKEIALENLVQSDFKLGEFFSLHSHREKNIPYGELLLDVTESGLTTEEFLNKIRKRIPDDIIAIDLQIFELAILKHIESDNQNNIVSINLDAETFFDQRLIEKIEQVINNSPQFNPNKIWLEITEHGDVPKNFDGSTLSAIKSLGFKLALDDFHPKESDYSEWIRLEMFAPYLDAIKFPFQIMESLRKEINTTNTETPTSDLIRHIKKTHPNKILVMEGVQKNDENLFAALKNLGIDIIQKSEHTRPPSKPLALEP